MSHCGTRFSGEKAGLAGCLAHGGSEVLCYVNALAQAFLNGPIPVADRRKEKAAIDAALAAVPRPCSITENTAHKMAQAWLKAHQRALLPAPADFPFHDARGTMERALRNVPGSPRPGLPLPLHRPTHFLVVARCPEGLGTDEHEAIVASEANALVMQLAWSYGAGRVDVDIRVAKGAADAGFDGKDDNHRVWERVMRKDFPRADFVIVYQMDGKYSELKGLTELRCSTRSKDPKSRAFRTTSISVGFSTSWVSKGFSRMGTAMIAGDDLAPEV